MPCACAPRRQLALLAALLLPAVLALPAQASVTEFDEFELKAAIIVRLLNFVTWPEEFEALRLCIYGDTPIEASLREAEASGAAGRALDIDRITISSDAAGCNVLFVSALQQWRAAAMDELLRHDGVLTISDDEAFLCHGGMIRLSLRRNRPHIAVNAEAAVTRDVRISSKLHELSEPWSCPDGAKR